MGQKCAGGSCGGCVPGPDDPDNCGTCGNRCPLGDVCTNGMCSCAGTSCPAQPNNIPAVCISPGGNGNGLSCGACGVACNHPERCLSGQCACRPGLAQCSGGCVDVKGDLVNCGTCGNACGSGMKCSTGACVLACPPNTTDCNGSCLLPDVLLNSPFHCGSCANACAPDDVCAQGTCQQYFTSPSCTSCPCAACGTAHKCCTSTTFGTYCIAGTVCAAM
jgi:hypothetical protein